MVAWIFLILEISLTSGFGSSRLGAGATTILGSKEANGYETT